MTTNWPQGSVALIAEQDYAANPALYRALINRMDLKNGKVSLLSVGKRMTEPTQRTIRRMLSSLGMKGFSMVNVMLRIDGENPKYVERIHDSSMTLLYGDPAHICKLLPGTSIFREITRKLQSDSRFVFAGVNEAAAAFGPVTSINCDNKGLHLLEDILVFEKDGSILTTDNELAYITNDFTAHVVKKDAVWYFAGGEIEVLEATDGNSSQAPLQGEIEV